MFLRQSLLIFNSPGKKIAALHCQRARVSGNKNPSQPSCKIGFNQPAYLKCKTTHIASQRIRNFGVCQLASGGVRFETAIEVSIHNFSKVL